MGQAIATRSNGAALTSVSMEDIESVLVGGNLGVLTADQRVTYYRGLCESLELNPLSRPFEYLNLKGKLVLYAKKDCTEQLRRQRGVSIYRLDKEKDGTMYVVTAYARDKYGREDSDMGAVELGALKGEDLANAMMKAITKAKRRVTLSICGLAMPDESEIESIPQSAPAMVRADGVIVDKGEVPYIEHRRNSDPPRDAMKEETLDGRTVHAPVIDPATQRPVAAQYRNEQEDPETAHYAPRTTQDDVEVSAVYRKGIANLKGWMVNRGLAHENRELSIYLLNEAAHKLNDEHNGWTSRKQLTESDWIACIKRLGSLKPAELKAWVADYHATLEAEEAGATDPFAAEDDLPNCACCGLPQDQCNFKDAEQAETLPLDVPATAPVSQNAQLV